MDSEELTKTVDNIYKNILEKFNPGARQLITAGKSYLKALHGAAAATRIFNESLAKIALNAQQSEINDIGSALLGIVGVYKEIQEQQMNILKAFYVDLLVPLETNLDKDTKVVQYEQKKFLQQQKVRMENYQKAVSTMKKQRKKKPSSENTEKEIRNLQILQEQKKKLDAFCEQGYKNAITQERRRYGFVLERQCSIAKHLMTYHATGRLILENNLENWQEVAASREVIPASMFENGADLLGLKALDRLTNFDSLNGDNMSQLKKSCSVDAPYGDMRTLHETNSSYMQNSLSRAKSDFNIASKRLSNDMNEQLSGNWDQRVVVKAIYGYKPSGENQLPFEEADRIALVGGKANGWQFGENLRLKVFGWFPIAYTNAESNTLTGGSAYESTDNYRSLESGETKNVPLDMKTRNAEHNDRYENMPYNTSRSSDGMLADFNMQDDDGVVGVYRQMLSGGSGSGIGGGEENSPTRHMYGSDARYNSTANHNNHNSSNVNVNNNKKKYMRASPNKNPRPGPPPTLPAPVPTVQNRILNLSRSFCTPNAGPSSMIDHRRNKKLPNGSSSHVNNNNNSDNSPHMTTHHDGNQGKSNEATKTSLHSSNDSGFANEPPPQPAVDYSDEEQNNRVPIRYQHDRNMPDKGMMMMMKHHDVVSMTLNRSYRNSIGSQAEEKTNKLAYGLIASDDEILQGATGGGSIRRTKSFWKFRGKRGSNDNDILAGMSLWQHRDLVTARPPRSQHENDDMAHINAGTGTLTHNTSTMSKNNKMSKSVEKKPMPPRKDSFASMAFYDGAGNNNNDDVEDDENIYGMSTIKPQKQLAIKPNMHKNANDTMMSTLQRDQNSYKRNMKNVEPKRQSNGSRVLQQQQQQQQMMSESESTLKKKVTNGSSAKHYQNNRESYETDDFDNNDTLKLNKINDYFDEMTSNVAMTGGNGVGGLLVKTVKRKDILKQYYTSDDDDETDKYEGEEEEEEEEDDDDDDEQQLQLAEVQHNRSDMSKDIDMKSEGFDPYDCIVINDHLVHKNDAAAVAAHQRHQQQMRAKSYHEQEIKFQTFRTTMTKTQSLSLVPENNNGNKLSERKKANHEDVGDMSSPASLKYNTNNGNSKTMTAKRQTQQGQSTVQNLELSSPTATILPRTRLIKSSGTPKNELKGEQKIQQNNSNSKQNYANTYGPWFDFWDLQKQEQYFNQSLNRPQKPAKHANKN